MIIAAHGFKQSGKDTFGELLVSEYGFQRVAFADKVKTAIHVIFDIPLDLLHGDEAAKESPTRVRWSDLPGLKPPLDEPAREYLRVRELMQVFATEICRKQMPDIWCRVADIQPERNTVVTDVRFANEALYLKGLGALIVKLHRPGAPRGLHESEAGLAAELIDHELDNDGTLESFHRKSRALLRDLGIKPLTSFPEATTA
ncbi:MAG: hypothetical protein HQL31_09155 [Planctomycetes bacterium]|nr:hypothetical protein [Planctomycetota bacterium]